MSRNFGISNRAKLGLTSLLIFSSTVQASELSVNDSQGVPYLKVDAADGSVFDLNIVFNDSKLSKETDLTLTNKNGDVKKVTVAPTDVANGVSISNVTLGEYVVDTNSTDLKIKRVNVSDTTTASAVKSGEDTIGTTAYAVGAAAVVGGVVAVSAGSDGLDVFGGSNSSNNSSRSGSGTSSSTGSNGGSVGSAADPRIAPTSDFDPNFPTNDGGYDAAPDGGITFNPGPPAAGPGGGGGVVSTPTPVSSPIPAPPITNPMTPS